MILTLQVNWLKLCDMYICSSVPRTPCWFHLCEQTFRTGMQDHCSSTFSCRWHSGTGLGRKEFEVTSAAWLMVLITSASRFRRKIFGNSKSVCLCPSVIKVSFDFMDYTKCSFILSCPLFQQNTSGIIKVKRAMDSWCNMVQGNYLL